MTKKTTKIDKENWWIPAFILFLILIAVIVLCFKYMCEDCEDQDKDMPIQAQIIDEIVDDTQLQQPCPEIHPNPKGYWLIEETEFACKYCIKNCYESYSWWSGECWPEFEYILNKSNRAVLYEPNEDNSRFYDYTIKICREEGDVDYQIEHVKKVVSDNCLVIKEADGVTESRIRVSLDAYPDYQKYFVIDQGIYYREIRYIYGKAYCLEDDSICWIIDGDTCTYVDLTGDSK